MYLIVYIFLFCNTLAYSSFKEKTINILHLTTDTTLYWDIEPDFEFVRNIVNQRHDILPDYFVESYTYAAGRVSDILFATYLISKLTFVRIH